MKNSKKYLAAAMAALFMIVGFTGCGETKSNNSSAATADEATTESAKMNALETTTEIPMEDTSEAQEIATEETKSEDSEEATKDTTKSEDTAKKNEASSKKQNGSQGSGSGSSKKPSSVAVTSVNLSASSLSVKVGGSASFSVSLSPSNATDTSYTVTTSNGNATVSCYGGSVTVYGQAAGNCQLTVKSSNGKTAICNVNVYKQQNSNGNSGGGTQSGNNSNKNPNSGTITNDTLLTHAQLCTDNINKKIVDGINQYFINKGMTYDSSLNTNNSGWFLSGTNYYVSDNRWSVNLIISDETAGLEEELIALLEGDLYSSASDMCKVKFRCYYEKQSNGEYNWYFCHK